MNGKGKILTSMAIFGTVGIFVRYIPMASAGIAFCRGVLGCVFLLLLMALTGKTPNLQDMKRNGWILAISGAAIGINWILLFEAYKYTTVSNATLSYYFAPVLVTLACPVLFRETLTKKQLLCFFMSTLGIVLITGTGGTGGSNHLLGILFGLGAAVLYATVILVNKFIKTVDGIHRTLLQFLAAIVVLVPYVLSTGGITLGRLHATGWGNLLIVGLVHTGITYCMYFSALKELPGQKAAILSYIDPLVAVIISVTVLGESMTIPQILGGCLILGLTLWNEIS